jgi:hypothetical protein
MGLLCGVRIKTYAVRYTAGDSVEQTLADTARRLKIALPFLFLSQASVALWKEATLLTMTLTETWSDASSSATALKSLDLYRKLASRNLAGISLTGTILGFTVLA